jgi:hypothetical protein
VIFYNVYYVAVWMPWYVQSGPYVRSLPARSAGMPCRRMKVCRWLEWVR